MDFVMSGAPMDFSDWNSLWSLYGDLLGTGACGASMDLIGYWSFCEFDGWSSSVDLRDAGFFPTGFFCPCIEDDLSWLWMATGCSGVVGF